VALAGEAERQRCARDGLADIRWQGVPAAVGLDQVGSSPMEWAERYPRRIACAGRLERGRGFREAIWAVDILGQIFPDLHLLIAGAGPRRPDLQEMIDRLAIRNAHLLGDHIVTAELFSAADVCWVPTRIDRGRQAALEAMAMGRAVVASDVPCLRELIRDGETGYLVPPGDPVAIARRSRALLRDPELCARIGTAAQQEVLARFGLPSVATRWHGLYNDLAA
jgi:glycosyltransferase involved in cell wall biosynthesis